MKLCRMCRRFEENSRSKEQNKKSKYLSEFKIKISEIYREFRLRNYSKWMLYRMITFMENISARNFRNGVLKQWKCAFLYFLSQPKNISDYRLESCTRWARWFQFWNKVDFIINNNMYNFFIGVGLYLEYKVRILG